MKKSLLFIACFVSLIATAQINFAGNGKTGFGGPIGASVLSISDDGTTINFSLKKGTGSFNDALVLYIDSKTGGFTSTSTFTDNSDGLRTAITGLNANNTDRSTLTFPAGFVPDFAISVNKDFGGLWQLMAGVAHTYITSVNFTPTGNVDAATYTFSVAKSALGITGTATFKFLGTYISTTAYRADEAIGDLMTGFVQGYNNQTITSFNTYTSGSLPVTLSDFRAVKDQGKVQVKWTVAQETNIDQYDVQRSVDGVQFTTITTVKAKNQTGSSTYNIYDASPAKGTNYYRLVINERGRSEISKVVSIKNGSDKNSFLVQQTGNKLNIRLSGLEAGTYRLLVINSNGQLLKSISIQHDGSDASKQVDLNSNLAKGIYRISLQSSSSNSILTKSILLQ